MRSQGVLHLRFSWSNCFALGSTGWEVPGGDVRVWMLFSGYVYCNLSFDPLSICIGPFTCTRKACYCIRWPRASVCNCLWWIHSNVWCSQIRKGWSFVRLKKRGNFEIMFWDSNELRLKRRLPIFFRVLLISFLLEEMFPMQMLWSSAMMEDLCC